MIFQQRAAKSAAASSIVEIVTFVLAGADLDPSQTLPGAAQYEMTPV